MLDLLQNHYVNILLLDNVGNNFAYSTYLVDAITEIIC